MCSDAFNITINHSLSHYQICILKGIEENIISDVKLSFVCGSFDFSFHVLYDSILYMGTMHVRKSRLSVLKIQNTNVATRCAIYILCSQKKKPTGNTVCGKRTYKFYEFYYAISKQSSSGLAEVSSFKCVLLSIIKFIHCVFSCDI